MRPTSLAGHRGSHVRKAALSLVESDFWSYSNRTIGHQKSVRGRPIESHIFPAKLVLRGSGGAGIHRAWVPACAGTTTSVTLAMTVLTGVTGEQSESE